MDMSFFDGMLLPQVVAACLVLGYILKHWFEDTDNRYIPTILAVVGAVLACVCEGDISVALVFSGAFSALASTGLHQAKKLLIENK